MKTNDSTEKLKAPSGVGRGEWLDRVDEPNIQRKPNPRIVDCRCSACDWSGRALSNDLDCPECGEAMRVDENLMAEDFQWNDPDLLSEDDL